MQSSTQRALIVSTTFSIKKFLVAKLEFLVVGQLVEFLMGQSRFVLTAFNFT